MGEQEDMRLTKQAQRLVQKVAWSKRLCWRSGEHPEHFMNDFCTSEYVTRLFMQIRPRKHLTKKGYSLLERRKSRQHVLQP